MNLNKINNKKNYNNFNDSHDLCVKVLTFNLGHYANMLKDPRTQFKLKLDLQTMFIEDEEDMDKFKKTIFIICTQEDKKESIFMKTVIDVLTKINKRYHTYAGGSHPDYIKLINDQNEDNEDNENNLNIVKPKHMLLKHLSTGPMLPLNFHIHTAIIIPVTSSKNIKVIDEFNIIHSKDLDNDSDEIKKKKFSFKKLIYRSSIINTKNTIGCVLQIKNPILNKFSNLLIMNSHLPMNSKTSNLGFDIRRKSLYQIIRKINPILQKMNGNYQAILTGDLNFRLDQKNHIDSNQYLRLLNKEKTPLAGTPFRDMLSINKFHPTCKTLTQKNNISFDKKKKCKIFEESLEKNNSDGKCYKIMTKKGIRIPSYCDRILISSGRSSKLIMEPISLKPLVEYNFINYSDHNPLMGELKLQFKTSEPVFRFPIDRR